MTLIIWILLSTNVDGREFALYVFIRLLHIVLLPHVTFDAIFFLQVVGNL